MFDTKQYYKTMLKGAFAKLLQNVTHCFLILCLDDRPWNFSLHTKEQSVIILRQLYKLNELPQYHDDTVRSVKEFIAKS